MTSRYQFLYLEDSPEDLELLVETLKREYMPCEVSWVNGRDAFENALAGGWGYDLIFADYFLPDIHGDLALAIARQRAPNVPFIFVSGSLGEERAVECLRMGATDYVLKGHLGRLALVVRRALEEARESAARREAEAATSRVVALLRATLEATSEGILVTDLAGRISTYNRKFMALCGIPDYVMAPMEMDRVLQFLVDQFQDPEAFLAEARMLGTAPERERTGRVQLKDDRVLEGSIRPTILGNQPSGQVFSFRDVTAREQAKERLEALVNPRQILLDAAGAVGVVAWSLQDDSLLMAKAGEAILGLAGEGRPRSLEELVALIHPEEADRFREALERPSREPFDLRLRKGDGWVWTRWFLDRGPEGYRGVFLDSTVMRQDEDLQERFRRRQRVAFLAEHTTQAIRKRVLEVQEALERLRAAGILDADLQAAARAVARMERVMDQATLAARCDPETTDFLEVPPLLEAFRVMAESRLPAGVALNLHLEHGLPRLAMNPSHLLEVLMNLFLNALQAVGATGAITCRLGPQRAPGKGIFIGFRDDGPGIPAGVQSRMFEPFFTTREDADGLGLAVVKNIVDSYHGSIEVATGPGKGTEVRILL